MISDGIGGKTERSRGKERGQQAVRGKYKDTAFHIHDDISEMKRFKLKEIHFIVYITVYKVC